MSMNGEIKVKCIKDNKYGFVVGKHYDAYKIKSAFQIVFFKHPTTEFGVSTTLKSVSSVQQLCYTVISDL